MIKVSVIVPVYNVEKYISKCLESLVEQTLKEIEIIVVNDGSLDNSQKIIDKFVKQYPDKIKSYIKENGGQGSARNLGLKYAKGEYISFVDSDDFIDKDMLEKMYNLAKKDNSDIVICGNKNITMDNKIKSTENARLFDDAKLNILFGKMAVWNKIYKRELIEKNNLQYRNNVWYEDIDFSIIILLDDVKISFLDEPLYNYLLRPGSTMNNSNIAKNLDILLAFNEMIEYYQKNQKYVEVYPELEFLALYHIYIASITRVLLSSGDKKKKKEVIFKLREYMNNKFPTFKNNQYKKYMSKNKKLVYHLINMKLYNIIKMLFNIKEKLQ